MGSCASHCSTSEWSAVKVPTAAETTTDKFEILPSPIKHFTKSDIIKDISVISHHYKTTPGSKELDEFFDSRECLDSDCEDFVSAIGDFTPSGGNTPLHNCPAETPRGSKVGAGYEPPSLNRTPSPAMRRKKLADLFRESPVVHPSFGFLNYEADNGKADLPFAGGDKVADQKSVGFGSKLCCLMVSRHGWSKRKEQLMLVNG